MFRSNKRHLQPALISSVNELPEKRRQRLEESWAGTFRDEFFSRLKEEAFAVLYSDVPSRPNVPVNVLVSLDTLKAGYGWSDEELYDHFLYDLQVRYAVGYESLTEGEFELRTLYNFRRRLSQYNVEHGTNLLETAFADITDQQITVLAVRTGQQRMDSTQIASNIVIMSRLQLTVEAIQRLHRLLSEADRVRYAELLAPYVGETAGHYVYRVKGHSATDAQLQPVGQVLYQLLQEMADRCGQEPAYQVAARLFAEQFRVEAETTQPKANKEISASSLQSLDDLEATYREKNHVGYKGYVANVTETCDPENALQLITDVRVAPNTTEDGALLVAALPDLKERTGLGILYTDGAFGGPQSDTVLREQQVTLIQTAIVGPKPDPEKLHLADFAITQDDHGLPLTITCPQGQTVSVTPGRKPQRFAAHFDIATCETCPLYTAGRCPPQPDNRRRTLRLTFNQAEVEKSQRHRRSRATHAADHNPRAAIEATVRSVKHPFPAGKLPVRGLFRMTCLIVASAAMTNVRRIQRYLRRTRPEAPERQENRRGLQRSFVPALAAYLPATFLAVARVAFLPLPAPRLRFSC
jgi:Transposase DDE domain